MIAVLYDIEGNLAALEAVLDDAISLGCDRFLIGGDNAGGPWPSETVALIRHLPGALYVRGNADRWLVDPPNEAEAPAHVREMVEWTRASLSEEDVHWLGALPDSVELDKVLFVHGSPLSDLQSFLPEPSPNDERLVAGTAASTICFGHFHMQFVREGPSGKTLVNPGSVGLPWDGDPTAAWATYDGSFQLRRTAYDVRRAVETARRMPEPTSSSLARSYETGRR